MKQGEITWIRCRDSMPDDKLIVLIATDERDVDCGFRESGKWYWADTGAQIMRAEVTHWAELPDHPGAA